MKIKVKELKELNQYISQLPLEKQNVRDALEGLQKNITAAEEKSDLAQINKKINEIQMELKEISLVRELNKYQAASLEVELDIEESTISGKINVSEEVKEALKGLLF